MESEKKRYFMSDDETKSGNNKSNQKYKKKTNNKEQGLDKPIVYNVTVNKKSWERKIQHQAKSQESIKKDKRKRKYPGKAPLDKEQLARHSRGEGLHGAGVVPRRLEQLKKREKKIDFAIEQAARAEVLLTEESGLLEVDAGRKTTAVRQRDIVESIDIAAGTKSFELQLDNFGPYRFKYTRNGRHLLLGGKKGHVAAFDWVTKKLMCEINVMESVHDVSWLHIETMYAVAQKEWLHIYDSSGVELHCVKKIDKVTRMEFLPYHFLLACLNDFGFLSWLDISVGEIVGHYNSKLGRSTVMTHNPYNATLCVGNSKGVVSLWSPSVKEPLAKILCHRSPVSAVAVNTKGMYMATAGVDKSLKIWDIRNLDGPLEHYHLRSTPSDLDFSQKDMLAVALGNVVEVYKDCCTATAKGPYMRHFNVSQIGNQKFCPYEDVLGVATAKGFISLIVPGSGEANFDALESNPFQSKAQRSESEVKALLEKIPADLITLDPFEVAEVDVSSLKQKNQAREALQYLKPQKIDFTARKKKKGLTNIARKKILKDVAKKEQILQIKNDTKLIKPVEKSKTPAKSFGVLDRFVKKNKK